MSYENTSGLNVSTQYGARTSGGSDGSQVTSDSRRIYVVDLEGEKPEERQISIPNDGIVENVSFEGTKGTATVEINGTDVTAAVWGTPVSFTAGDLTANAGTGTGKVKITTMLKDA